MEKRFVVVYKSGHEKIIVDKETGVNYIYITYSYGAGLTPLLDSEGKPIVSKPKVHEEFTWMR